VSWNTSARQPTVRDITGVRGVTNLIALQPEVDAPDVKSKIEADVVVEDGKVILSGNVRSWFQRSCRDRGGQQRKKRRLR